MPRRSSFKPRDQGAPLDRKEDNDQWLSSTLSAMKESMKGVNGKGVRRSKPGWNSRIELTWKKGEYDSTKDPYCPLGKKVGKKRSRRPQTAGGSVVSPNLSPMPSNASTSHLLSLDRASSSRLHGNSSSRPKTASARSLSSSKRLSQSSGSRARRKNRKAKRLASVLEPVGGVTFQQAAGKSGAKDDLAVVFKILEREAIVARLQKRCREFLQNHEWLAVPLEGGVSRSTIDLSSTNSSIGNSTVSTTNQTSVASQRRSEGAVAKGKALIYGIRDDLERIQPISLEVIKAIFRWRKDQVLTLHERQNQHLYPPKPFVYNGHDYLLKMVNDLNFLKEVQPITVWLGQPLSRNPFALLATDSNCLDNLEMQFDGSTSDLAACSHDPPPVAADPQALRQRLIHWGSLLLLAQEAIYGRGVDPMDMESHRTSASRQAGVRSSTLHQGSSLVNGGKLAIASDMITRSIFKDAGIDGETQPELDLLKYESTSRTKKAEKCNEKQAKGNSAKKERARVLSRVHQVISQNANLRRELIRMRGALEMERETLRRLEMNEDTVE